MNKKSWSIPIALVVLLGAVPTAPAQVASRAPHIGYAFPAGGQVGATVTVSLGGQFLNGADSIYVSGSGVHATVVKLKKPMSNKDANILRDKLKKAREKAVADRPNRKFRGKKVTNAVIAQYAMQLGVSREQLEAFNEYRRIKSDPKRQLNPQLAEQLIIEVTIDPDAAPGRREIRVKTTLGLTSPVWFDVGTLREYNESEPNDNTLTTDISESLPFVLNGQILPGDVDRFRFAARRGQRLVVAASARDLMPYLADAVPGWFQATLTLYDTDGKELAYDDDFEFHPDPVLFYRIPKDGQYVLEIKDAIYRGREDFVYRVTMGEIPFVTSIFPLGCQVGHPASFALQGWNLRQDQFVFDATQHETGIASVPIPNQKHGFNQVKIAVDALPDLFEQEPNDQPAEAQQLDPPIIINGRIDRPGDRDVFRFVGREGGQIALDVQARRLNSPVDSLVKLTDEAGRSIAANDDCDDQGDGLTTHHADSHLLATLPRDGVYYVHLTDTQDHGGEQYAYRLRVSARQPDFALRVTPSSINARPGTTVPITVHALRKDGFDGDIFLSLRRAPFGFSMSGSWIPAGQEKMRVTLTIPRTASQKPVALDLVGRAVVAGHPVTRTAVAADDMVQAFIYHHLVPASKLLLNIAGPARYQVLAQRQRRGKGKMRRTTPLKSFGRTAIKLPVGRTTNVPILANAPAAADQVQFVLNDGLEGISVKKIKTQQGGLALQVKTDPEKVKPGTKGNLIVDLFVERSFAKKGSKGKSNKRRIAVGTLPAIPFEIVRAG